jgi:hypothetical protein
MIYNGDRPSGMLVAELLEASARTGFSLEEIEALVNSDLELQYLLDYITAVISKRMN